VPNVLRDRYGEFARFVEAERFTTALVERTEHRPPLREDVSGDFARIHIEGTSSYVHTVRDPTRVRNAEPGFGDI
jgi:hypothetical protein